MMKTIYTIASIMIFTLSGQAQAPVLPRYHVDDGQVENAYYKDVDNIHDQYIGTWLYSNGNTSLKIVLREREMVYVSNPSIRIPNVYEDILVGEYQYIENGVEKINTLANLNQEYSDNTNYNLYSLSLKGADSYPKCNECFLGEKVLCLKFNEPLKKHLIGLSRDFIIRRFFDDGIEKLKVWFVRTDNGFVVNSNTMELSDIERFLVPYGEYILIKQ